MDNLIAYDEFEGTISIDILREEVQEQLELYISSTQEKILRWLLGDNLYFDFVENESETKYQTLINGDTIVYTYNGVKGKYTGLKDMLKYFTYFYYTRQEVSSNTSMGETMSTSQNGQAVQNNTKLIDAWNQGVRLYDEAINYIQYKGETVYSELDSTELKKINQFGI